MQISFKDEKQDVMQVLEQLYKGDFSDKDLRDFYWGMTNTPVTYNGVEMRNIFNTEDLFELQAHALEIREFERNGGDEVRRENVEDMFKAVSEQIRERIELKEGVTVDMPEILKIEDPEAAYWDYLANEGYSYEETMEGTVQEVNNMDPNDREELETKDLVQDAEKVVDEEVIEKEDVEPEKIAPKKEEYEEKSSNIEENERSPKKTERKYDKPTFGDFNRDNSLMYDALNNLEAPKLPRENKYAKYDLNAMYAAIYDKDETAKNTERAIRRGLEKSGASKESIDKMYEAANMEDPEAFQLAVTDIYKEQRQFTLDKLRAEANKAAEDATKAGAVPEFEKETKTQADVLHNEAQDINKAIHDQNQDIAKGMYNTIDDNDKEVVDHEMLEDAKKSDNHLGKAFENIKNTLERIGQGVRDEIATGRIANQYFSYKLLMENEKDVQKSLERTIVRHNKAIEKQEQILKKSMAHDERIKNRVQKSRNFGVKLRNLKHAIKGENFETAAEYKHEGLRTKITKARLERLDKKAQALGDKVKESIARNEIYADSVNKLRRANGISDRSWMAKIERTFTDVAVGEKEIKIARYERVIGEKEADKTKSIEKADKETKTKNNTERDGKEKKSRKIDDREER